MSTDCPMKFANPAAYGGNSGSFNCPGPKCPWWSKYHDCCSIVAASLALQAIAESLKRLEELYIP